MYNYKINHLPFSQNIKSGEDICDISVLKEIIENKKAIVITEQLNGEDCYLSKKGVFAGSISNPTSETKFNYIKNEHYLPKKVNFSNKKIFGKNLYGSNYEYTNLKDYFYVFGILESSDIDNIFDKSRMSDRFMSWDDTMRFCNSNKFEYIPVVYEGKIESLNWLENFLNEESEKESALGVKEKVLLLE